MQQTTIQARFEILQYLYDQAITSGPGLSLFVPETFPNLTLNELRFHLEYLQGKHLIYDCNANKKRCQAGITADGCDIIEYYKLGISFDTPEKVTFLEKATNAFLSTSSSAVKSSGHTLITLVLEKLLS